MLISVLGAERGAVLAVEKSGVEAAGGAKELLFATVGVAGATGSGFHSEDLLEGNEMAATAGESVGKEKPFGLSGVVVAGVPKLEAGGVNPVLFVV